MPAEKRAYAGAAAGADYPNKAGKASVSDAVAQARARAAAVAARMAAGKGAASPAVSKPPSPSPSQSPRSPPAASDNSRLAAIKARMAALKADDARRASMSVSPPPPPPPVRPSSARPPPPSRDNDDDDKDDVDEETLSGGRGGLSVLLHPALMGKEEMEKNAAKGKGRFGAGRFATAKGNQRSQSPLVRQLDLSGPDLDEIKKNPYYDARLGGAKVRERAPRALDLSAGGKHLEAGEKLRAEERLEMIRRTIAERARLAGLDENNERGFIVPPPPDIEWWDETLLETTAYDNIDVENVNVEKMELISDLVQHPVLLKAAQDKLLVEQKAMYLTQKEQAKIRRMRRQQELKEQQAKQRLGLEPPPPPKVKRGNMMRVMGEQAIADPTAVEMLVEAQIEARHQTHLTANEERKLTKEQRNAKLAEQQVKDAKKGLYICVYRVDSFASGKHRYLVDHNAKEHALTGIILYNKLFNLVILEGGHHSVAPMKKLMRNRIRWDENSVPSAEQLERQAKEVSYDFLNPLEKDGETLKDLSQNKCILVFEGEVLKRQFRKWGSRITASEGDAREFLSRNKLDSLWELAKSATEDD